MAQIALPHEGHMSHSHVNTIMNEVLPQGPSLSLPLSSPFVRLRHRDVTVVLAAPPLLNFHKAEVGQI